MNEKNNSANSECKQQIGDSDQVKLSLVHGANDAVVLLQEGSARMRKYFICIHCSAWDNNTSDEACASQEDVVKVEDISIRTDYDLNSSWAM